MRNWLAVPLFVLFATSLMSAAAGTINFRVRDDTTGYAVQATITVKSAAPGNPVLLSRRTDNFGRLRLNLRDGRYLFDVVAAGYDPMTGIRYELPTTVEFGTTNLSRRSPPPEMRPDVLDPQIRKGYVLMLGYVVDADTGRPLPNAHVRMPKLGVDATTNERGYFGQSVRMPVVAPPETGTSDDLIVTRPGYKTYVLTNLALPNEGWQLFQANLQKGTGRETHDLTPVPLQDPGTVIHEEAQPAPNASLATSPAPSACYRCQRSLSRV